ncbi:hypothetical protein [Mycobacterium sp.]|jgi:hypothetical protein|uniref:hypothetical protein n=1 Tax=Mycobacterium sp. TaxID=1785 RepID=UPI0025809A5A|nr:hypothetical protein [Mycobacterium sp.]
MYGKKISEVLRQRGRTRGAPPLLKSFGDDARRANHDYFPIAFGVPWHEADPSRKGIVSVSGAPQTS